MKLSDKIIKFMETHVKLPDGTPMKLFQWQIELLREL